jgi:hypothetical protein
MRSLKAALTTLLVLALLAAGVVGMFWEELLTPAQKLHYGLVFSAARGYAQQAAQHPQSASGLKDYVAALTLEGNLGRAGYLADLYGADNADLAALRKVVDQGIAAMGQKQTLDCLKDPAVQKFKGQPVYETFRFLEGYEYALQGDWASARNYFEALDDHQLAPDLRGYARYFRARAYRLAGDDKQKAQVGKILLGVINSAAPLDLRARARYNLIAYYLSDAYKNDDGIALARDQELLLADSAEGWAVQKAYTDIGQYYLDHGDVKEAWRRAVVALQTGPDTPAGASAGKLCIDTLKAVLHKTVKGGMDDKGALTLDQPQQVYLDLAQCSIASGSIDDYLPVFSGLLNHVQDRARWEELRVALAMCYRKQGKLPEIRKLLTEANLSNFSDAATAALLFELAQTEEDQQQWNDAFDHYRSCARLGGVRGPAAAYGCYSILKHTQDPLNLDSAAAFLTQAANAPPEDPVQGKALEELLPLLIFRGQGDAARKLAERVLSDKFQSGAPWPQEAAHEQLQEVAHTWLAYLAAKAGDKAAADDQRRQIPCRFWSYYELVNNYPPAPQLKAQAEVLQTDEEAGEYFAGLGLETAAEEFYQGGGHEDSQLLQYFKLHNGGVTKSLSTQQWDATALLEDGRIREQPLLDYALSQAYPQPYSAEAQAAAAEFKVPAPLIYAIIKKESAFKADNVSWAGAQGLMQVMPDTASFINNSFNLGLDTSQLKDPKANLRLGAANLRMLFDQLGAGNVRGVICAHNKGAGNYQKWQQLYPADPQLFTELIPNDENESFSKLVWKYYMIYKWLEQ